MDNHFEFLVFYFSLYFLRIFRPTEIRFVFLLAAAVREKPVTKIP